MIQGISWISRTGPKDQSKFPVDFVYIAISPKCQDQSFGPVLGIVDINCCFQIVGLSRPNRDMPTL